MIFAGDVAIAPGDRLDFIGFSDALRSVPWCINLEGAIARDNSVAPDWGVVNCANWRASLDVFQLGPIFLANNHIHDIKNGVHESCAALTATGLCFFGAGNDQSAASRPAFVSSKGEGYVLLGFGWPVIGCVPAGRNTPGVNRLEGRSVLDSVGEAVRLAEGRGRVVLVMHGNYEFERYPQPAHRKLARQAIELGAYAVIFHHPHIVGPIERYKGRTIAYSLGNWAFSYGKFFDGKLKFPAASFRQVAIELSEGGDLVHHADFQPPATIRYIRTERVEAVDLSLRAEFEGLGDAEYVEWFKANRLKKKGLPVYRDAEQSWSNSLRDQWVGLRQVLIDFAAKHGLKRMRREAI